MPNQEEVKFAGVCIVNTESLNAIIEHLNTTQVGKILHGNLQSKQILDLHVDDVENLNAYRAEKRKKAEKKPAPRRKRKKKVADKKEPAKTEA